MTTSFEPLVWPDDAELAVEFLASGHSTGNRTSGVGTVALVWVTDHLFTTYEALHRIEATTRHDNVPMQRVFTRCGFRREGQMLEAWTNADGSRADTWTYAILRREWQTCRQA